MPQEDVLTDRTRFKMPSPRVNTLPFAQPPNVWPVTRAFLNCAQTSVASIRKWLPLHQVATLQQKRLLCTSSEHGGCNENDINKLLSVLFASVVPPAHADAPRKIPSTLIEEDFAKAAEAPELSLRYPAADRIVAIGDVHGDADAFKKSLLAAGVVDEEGNWSGGSTVLVQVGDQLDRGDGERKIYETLFHLQDTAPVNGGAVHILLGNHEIMNVEMDFRYVTAGGFADFQRNGGVKELPKQSKLRIPPPVAKTINQLPVNWRARAKALSPGGPLAVELARRAQIAVIIGDNVFVHGGLAPRHLTFGGKAETVALKTLEGINSECRDFMLGLRQRPMVLRGAQSPVWMRDYSRPVVRPASDTCRMLAQTLKMINVKRMIVGHTPQERGINAACSGRVWRIDTGMSAAYGGVPEAIEITKRGRIRIYNSHEGVIEGSARYR